MTASTVVGLALLPPIFFIASYLSTGKLDLFKIIFNVLGILSICIFFAYIPVEVPAFAVPFSYLYYAGIALLILYLFIELLALLSQALQALLPKQRRF